MATTLTRTEISNMALLKLGVSYAITSYDDDVSNQAKVIRRVFDSAMGYVVEASEWTFLTKYGPLSLLGPGTQGWGFEYALPFDCAVLRAIGPDGGIPLEGTPLDELNKWEYANDTFKIQCNVEKAYARYTREIASTEEVPNYFGQAVASRLAWSIAPALILDRFQQIKGMLEADLRDDFDRAISYDDSRKPFRERAQCSYLSKLY